MFFVRPDDADELWPDPNTLASRWLEWARIRSTSPIFRAVMWVAHRIASLFGYEALYSELVDLDWETNAPGPRHQRVRAAYLVRK